MTLDEFNALDPLALWAAMSPEHKAAVVIPLLTSVFAEVVQDDDGTDASYADREVAAGICQSAHQEIYDALDAAFPEILADDDTALHGFSANMCDAGSKVLVRGVGGKRVVRQTTRYSQSVRIGGRDVELAGFKNIGTEDAPVWQAWTVAQADAERVRRHPDQAVGPFLPTFTSVLAPAEPDTAFEEVDHARAA
jgi:hypothetical protein